jgi:hypothetical protein
MQHVSTFPSSCQCHVLFFPLLTLSSRVQCFHGLLIILYIFVQFPSQYANARKIQTVFFLNIFYSGIY